MDIYTYVTRTSRSQILIGDLVIFLWIIQCVSAGELKEYCFNKNNFNASCPAGHVILMEQAYYGRMRIGDCVSPGSPEVGCSANVLIQVDERCSGKRHCYIRIPDTALHQYPSCVNKDQLFYLEAAYKCQKVMAPRIEHCSVNHIINMDGHSQFISSQPLAHSALQKLPSTTCSFHISVFKGQKISVTLYDFEIFKRSEDKTRDKSSCIKYATIRSGDKGYNLRTVCSGTNRIQHIYTSHTNSLIIDIHIPQSDKEKYYFLLKYSAVGCADPVLPPGSWFQRNGSGAKVQCNSTSQTWHIVCRGNEWVGSIDNCTDEAGSLDDHYQGSLNTFPFSLLVAVFIGVFIGVMFGIGLLCFVSCLLRRHRERNRRQVYRHSTETELGPEHTMMLHSKYYPCNHNYECTNSSSPCHLNSHLHSMPKLTSQFTPEVLNECNINCPFNAVHQRVPDTVTTKKTFMCADVICPSSVNKGLQFSSDLPETDSTLPSIVKDSEEARLQQGLWDTNASKDNNDANSNLGILNENPVIHIKNIENNEVLMAHWPK